MTHRSSDDDRLWNQTRWAQILGLHPNTRVTLGNLLGLLDLFFFHKMGVMEDLDHKVLGGGNKSTHVQALRMLLGTE